jgi:BASS family bile acid:Na+ symporter
LNLDIFAQIFLAIGLMFIMFGIGLSLTSSDFARLLKQPCAILGGLTAQIIGLPLAALFTIIVFKVPPEFALGLMIIATSPGGATSNLFSYLMKGDVALSVSLTAAASVICIFTTPLILSFASSNLLQDDRTISLPVSKIFLPLVVLVLLPLLAGMFTRLKALAFSQKMQRPTVWISIFLLVFTIGYVFHKEHDKFFLYFGKLGTIVTFFILIALTLGFIIGYLAKLDGRQKKTVIIEVGIQNGVQAIVIATSPLIFNNLTLAIPATIYSVLMYIYIFLMYPFFRRI